MVPITSTAAAAAARINDLPNFIKQFLQWVNGLVDGGQFLRAGWYDEACNG
jgi:hypothetical protein